MNHSDPTWQQAPSRSKLGRAVACALLLSGIAACSKPTPSGPADYVALGSSFAAGPGVGAREPGSPVLCGRSQDNYAHLVARDLHLSLRDATCSSATTADILHEHQHGLPPQIDSVSPGTKLVTVTIGGNDVDYLGSLSAQSCARSPQRVPWLWRGAVCKPSGIPVAQAFGKLPSQLTQIVRAIRKRAPAARIVLLDYSTVLPSRGTCPDRAPLDEMDIRKGRDVADRLSQIISSVAQHEKVLAVSAAQATAEHDVCSHDPWVNGFTFNTIPLTWGAFAYHPNDKGMLAVSRALQAVLTSRKILPEQ